MDKETLSRGKELDRRARHAEAMVTQWEMMPQPSTMNYVVELDGRDDIPSELWQEFTQKMVQHWVTKRNIARQAFKDL